MNKLGTHYGSCPNMGNLIATMANEKWSYDELVKNTVCHICNKEYFNRWYSCNRRQAMINTHPGLLCARRQHFYMVKLMAKYQITRYARDSNFMGHPGTKTELETYFISNPALPKELQDQTFIRHGKNDS